MYRGPPNPPAPGMFQPQAPGMYPPPGGAAAPPPPGAAAPPQMMGGMAPPPQPGMAQVGQGQTLFQEKIDYNIKIPDRLFKFTADKIPQTPALANSSKIPLGGILRPLAPCGEDEEEVPTVQPGSAGIIRCKRCRTYINAFVHWVENGRRWRCNICAQINDTPSAYFCHLDEEGLRRDRNERPELSKGVVEFIAPAEYMVRPPQEPSYFFVLDVSAMAVRSGMLHAAANAIRRSLDDLPGRGRTKIGFITFDNSVHYYNLGSGLSQPQMLVVSDLKELFVPLPDNLLVNLQESRSVVEKFLDNLPDMFSKNPVLSQSCLGPALKAAFTVMKQVGGKMSVFQAIMPNLGDGALKPRMNQAFMGTPNEVKLLRPDTTWYKDTAIEFSRQQISVDMFLFPYQYMDLAALGELPKMTAGNLYSYVSFSYEKDGERFEEQLHKTLVSETAFEAVMRIRCTKGMRIPNFYGNFYIRGTDLMALPNVNSDSVFGFDLVHDEQNVASNYITIQAALLYTSSTGQRRIRVMTQALPITGLTSELVDSVDTQATCNLLCKQAVDVCIKTNVDNARMRLQQTCVDIIRSAKGGDKRTVSGYTVPKGPQPDEGEEKALAEPLKLLPLYTLAMMKNVAFRGGTDVHPDERTQAFHLINQMWTSTSKYFIYPRMFSLHDMGADCGYPFEETTDDDTPDDAFAGRTRTLLPQTLPLSIDNLSSDGIFLLDNGVDMFIWVGRSADQSTVNSLFGVPSLENADLAQIKLQTDVDDYSQRVGAIVTSLRDDVSDPFFVSSKIQIVKEGDQQMEARFFWFLVEDSASFQGGTYSYEDFMSFVMTQGTTGPPGAGPPGAGAPTRGPPGAMGGPAAPMGRGPPGSPAPMGRGPPGPPGPPAPMGVSPMGRGPPGAPSSAGMPPPAGGMAAPMAGMPRGPPGPPVPAIASTQPPVTTQPGPPRMGGPPSSGSSFSHGPPPVRSPPGSYGPPPGINRGPPTSGGAPPVVSRSPPPPQNGMASPPAYSQGPPPARPPVASRGPPPPRKPANMPPPPGRPVARPPPPGPPRGAPRGPPRGPPPPPPPPPAYRR